MRNVNCIILYLYHIIIYSITQRQIVITGNLMRILYLCCRFAAVYNGFPVKNQIEEPPTTNRGRIWHCILRSLMKILINDCVPKTRTYFLYRYNKNTVPTDKKEKFVSPTHHELCRSNTPLQRIAIYVTQLKWFTHLSAYYRT